MALRDNVRRVRERIVRACTDAGRSPEEVTLVAVTKTWPVDLVIQAISAGLADFGENRLQEAVDKIGTETWPREITWHFIGHLQRNKAKKAVDLFDLIETVDSLKLAADLDRHAENAGRVLPVLLQVNVGDDPRKWGVRPEEAAGIAESIRALPHVDLRGLMTVPPYTEDPAGARPYFAELRRLRDGLEGVAGPLPELSMGMSHDFEEAIREGATIVRVGSALFGTRVKGPEEK